VLTAIEIANFWLKQLNSPFLDLVNQIILELKQHSIILDEYVTSANCDLPKAGSTSEL
jgi:hypothetical protein